MKLAVPYFLQSKEITCGPTCLRMMFAFFGSNYSEKYLIKLCRTNKRGTTHHNLASAVRKEGYSHRVQSKSTTTELKFFLDAGYPVLKIILNKLHKKDIML